MLDVIDQIVYGRFVVGVALAVFTAQVVVLVVAARRRARTALSLKVHAMAGAVLLVLPVATGVSVNAARTMLLDPKLTNINPGIFGQLNAISFAVATAMLALMFWIAGLVFTLSAPGPQDRARGFPTAALIGLGLFPICYGALEWATTVIKTFFSFQSASQGASGDAKAVALLRAMDDARPMFESEARISTIAIPALTVLAVALTVMRDRKRNGAAVPARPRSQRITLAGTAAALLAALLLVIEARPMASENAMPWPPLAVGERLNIVDPPTPDLAGPDGLERAPVVQIHKDRLGLDGTNDETFESLQEKLLTLRSFHRRLHPDTFFEGAAVVLADPTTPMPRLHGVLRALRAEEYTKPLFAFTKAEVVVRPVFGKLQRVNGSAAHVRLAYIDDKDEDEYEDDADAAAWKNAVRLRPQDFPAYDAFARRLVQLRRDGKAVIVTIDRPSR